MTRIEGTVYCENCGVEIISVPLVVKGHDYCCQDCYDGLECNCRSLIDLMEEDEQVTPFSTSGLQEF